MSKTSLRDFELDQERGTELAGVATISPTHWAEPEDLLMPVEHIPVEPAVATLGPKDCREAARRRFTADRMVA